MFLMYLAIFAVQHLPKRDLFHRQVHIEGILETLMLGGGLMGCRL